LIKNNFGKDFCSQISHPAMPSKIYNTVQTIPNVMFGGVKDERCKKLYHVLIFFFTRKLVADPAIRRNVVKKNNKL
jgi:hypothetical protein